MKFSEKSQFSARSKSARSKLGPTHPDFGSKTDFIFAQECLRFRKPEVLWMHALINTTLEIARNRSACVLSSHYSYRVCTK